MSVRRTWLRGATAVLTLLAATLLWTSVVFAEPVKNGTESKPSTSKAGTPAMSEQERSERLKQLELASERLYEHMQQGSGQEALADMEALIQALEGVSFKGLTSVEGIHALAETIMDTKETLVRADAQPEAWALSSARLRLAVNSLLHPDKALWQQYYKVMFDDLQQMKQARAGGKPAGLRKAFQALQDHYDVVRPAAVIRRPASEINRFESWLSYTEGLSGAQSWDEKALKGAIEQGEGELKALFGRRGDEPVFLPVTGVDSPWYWSALIGLWIVLALTYTGIRKYRADRAVTAVRAQRPAEEMNRYRL